MLIKSIFLKKIILIIFGIIAGTILISTLKKSESPTLNIEVSASKEINNIEVYVNNLRDSPKKINNIGKNKNNYNLNIINNIEFLRIDLGDVIENRIRIYSLSFNLNKQIIPIELYDLSLWRTNDLILVSKNKNYIEYLTTGNDPFIYNHINIKFKNFQPSSLRNNLINLLTVNDTRYVYLYLAAGLILVFLIFNKINNFFIKKIKVVMMLLFSLIIFYYMPDIDIFGDFTGSIGRASYNQGFFLSNVNLSILISLLIISAIMIIIKNKLNLVNGYIYENPRGNRFILLITIVLIFLYFTVDLRYELDIIKNAKLSYDWDSSNISYWSYLIGSGEIPYRDFWYPYGGFSLMEISFPFGVLVSSFYKIIIYSVFAYIFYKIITSNLCIYIPTIFFILAGRETNFFWGLDRYLLSILILLSFIYLYKAFISKNDLLTSRILFLIVFLIAIIFEPPQLLYVTPGLIIIFIYDYLVRRDISFIKYFLVKIGIPLSIILFILSYILYRYNILNSLFEFYSTLGGMSQGSQVFINYKNLLVSPNFYSLFLVATFGIFIILNIRVIFKNSDLVLTYLTIGFFSISLSVLQKHLIRPMDWQFIIIPFLYFLIYTIYTGNIISNKYMFILYGTLISFQINTHNLSGIIEGYFNHIYGGFSRFTSTIDYLRTDFIPINKIDSDNFNIESDEYKVAKYISMHSGKKSDLYVLTDSSHIYIYYRGMHPYHANTYNMSPLSEQINNLNWIIENKPKFVVLDSGKLNFDLVPNVIRIPLIYKYIINNYSFDSRVGKFDILKLNVKNNDIDYIYWSKLLGNSVDLKYIPFYTKTYLCDGHINNLDNTIARIQIYDNIETQSEIILRVHNKLGDDFYVKFLTSNKKSVYWINLDRLWFYNESLVDYIRPVNSDVNISLKKCNISNSRLY